MVIATPAVTSTTGPTAHNDQDVPVEVGMAAQRGSHGAWSMVAAGARCCGVFFLRSNFVWSLSSVFRAQMGPRGRRVKNINKYYPVWT